MEYIEENISPEGGSIVVKIKHGSINHADDIKGVFNELHSQGLFKGVTTIYAYVGITDAHLVNCILGDRGIFKVLYKQIIFKLEE